MKIFLYYNKVHIDSKPNLHTFWYLNNKIGHGNGICNIRVGIISLLLNDSAGRYVDIKDYFGQKLEIKIYKV